MSTSAQSLYSSNGMISNFMPVSGITARENMQFQEYLSNTSHQREMADLKAAGLNPWLASNSGASVPSGSVDSGEVLSMLNGNSARHGSGSSVKEEGSMVSSVLTALGMRKSQAEAIGDVFDWFVGQGNGKGIFQKAWNYIKEAVGSGNTSAKSGKEISSKYKTADGFSGRTGNF